MTARRLAKELEKIAENFDAECKGDDLFKWQVAILGPDNSPYFGGTFIVELTFPEDYPFRAPDVRMETKIYHPNINHKGEICLGVLKDGWNPSVTAREIVEGIVQLLLNPNPEDPLVPEIASLIKRDPATFKTKAEEWTHKYALM